MDCKRLIAPLLMAAWFFTWTVPSVAQEEADEDQAEESAEEYEDIIVVRSRRQLDNAMDAFQRGDFEVAEIEFQANARCALRRERELAAAVDGARRDSARGESLGEAASGQPSGASGPGQAGGGSQASSGSSGAPSEGVRNQREERVERTCENRAFQLYMLGLSQLQNGKPEDARENFERATSIDTNLYDAHYRIALMAYLEGDEGTVRRRLRRIETVLRRCDECEARDEIIQRRDHLVAMLAGEVALQ